MRLLRCRRLFVVNTVAVLSHGLVIFSSLTYLFITLNIKYYHNNTNDVKLHTDSILYIRITRMPQRRLCRPPTGRTITPHHHSHWRTVRPLFVELFGMAVNLHDLMSGECHTHLVSLIKHHGLFVPYIADIFHFLIRESWFSAPYKWRHFLFFNSRILI